MSLCLRLGTLLGPQSHLPRSSAFAAAAAAACLSIYIATRTTRESLQSRTPDIIPGPREISSSDVEHHLLPYPPDVFPGRRDVDSPYGSVRVYEWGPEDGRKVLFLHGISTPSIVFASLAHKLVERGCRVMLFDLFGRGYSSTPSTHNTPYNSQLYTSQMLICLSSSPLSWTTSGLTLIGYSLGGGLAADFTSYFPQFIRSLILIAPGGLIRTEHISWKSRLLYSTSGLLPEALIETLVAKRLYTGPLAAQAIEPEMEPKTDSHEKNSEESMRDRSLYESSHAQLLPGFPNSTVGAVVDWQIANNRGFVPAFISSIRFAPIHDQHERWRVIGRRLAKQAEVMSSGHEESRREEEGLEQNKVLLILGERDSVILAEEVAEDAKGALGAEHLEVQVVAGATHEVPFRHAAAVAEIIHWFWGDS